MNFKSQFLQEMQSRGFIAQMTNQDELDNLMSGTKISAYIGFDCTAKSLHVGSLIQIMILRLLQKHGHRPIILLGGGTTKIGDPSGKDEARQILSEEKIQQNLEGIKNTLAKFVSFDDGAKAYNESSAALLVNNNDWLKNLNYIDFLRDIGRHFSINRMLTFDSVKTRLERDQPLSFLEFNYMILQAYDFYELNKEYGCCLQIGGSDQWGNIVNGVELVRRVRHVENYHKNKDENSEVIENSVGGVAYVTNFGSNEELQNYKNSQSKKNWISSSVFGLTSPLLTTADGKKMGKTADGAVWLDESMLSPFEYFQYFRNTHDADVVKFLKLFTDLNLNEIAELNLLQGQEINKAKEILAFEVTKICHGEEAAQNALQKAREIFVTKNEAAYELKEISISSEGKKLIEIIKEIGAVESNGEAKRLIEGRGVKINDEAVLDANHLIKQPCEFNLSVGKKKFFRVVVGRH